MNLSLKRYVGAILVDRRLYEDDLLRYDVLPNQDLTMASSYRIGRLEESLIPLKPC